MRMQLRPLVLLLLFSILAPSVLGQTAVKISSAERKIAEGITADQLRDYLYFVASDQMGGRDTPSKELDLTAKFIGTMNSGLLIKNVDSHTLDLDNSSGVKRITFFMNTVSFKGKNAGIWIYGR